MSSLCHRCSCYNTMRSFRKTVLVIIIIVASFSISIYKFNGRKRNCKTTVKSVRIGSVRKNVPDAVILLSHIGQGSDVVGKFFNEKEGVAYFHNPLIPFGTCPKNKSKEVTEYLKHVLQADFVSAFQVYKKSANFTSHPDIISRCIAMGVCYANCEKCSKFLSRDTDMCRTPDGRHICPKHLDLERLSKVVQKSNLIVLKVENLCDFTWIKSILRNSSTKVKIIHLVKDPRTIFYSLFQIISKPYNQSSTNYATKMCQRINAIVEYTETHLLLWNGYMRVRHEDIGLYPLKWMEMIYDFVNLTKPDELKNRDTNYEKQTAKQNYELISQWRKDIKNDIAFMGQTLCKSSMIKLGYLLFANEKNLRNLDIPFFK